MKHLLVDVRNALPAVDGIHTYLRNVVPALVARGVETGGYRTTLLCHPEMPAYWRLHADGAAVLVSPVAPMQPSQNWRLRAVVEAQAPDLYFYSAHDPPALVDAPLLFTIHDVTMFRLRPYFERFDRVKRAYTRAVMMRALHHSRAVIAVSETAKREIGAVFGDRYLPKIRVTPLGVSVPPMVSARPRDRFLYVGTDRIHKNLPRLITAYAAARRRRRDLPRLEIIGGLRRPELLRQVVRDEGVEDAVVLRGHVDAAALEEGYASAVALVFVSLAEGFGLPVLEAMARGVPVVTSNISACAEVAGDAALTVDPHDVAAVSQAIERVFADETLARRLAESGLERAASFGWRRTAELTAAAVEAALGSSVTR